MEGMEDVVCKWMACYEMEEECRMRVPRCQNTHVVHKAFLNLALILYMKNLIMFIPLLVLLKDII